MPRGGRIFELYLELMASWKSHTAYRKFLVSKADGEMDAELFDTIVSKERGPFHGFVILACGNICRAARRQRFWLTFVARFHGLARGGVRLLAHYGFLIKQTTYDKMESIILLEQNEKNR